MRFRTLGPQQGVQWQLCFVEGGGVVQKNFLYDQMSIQCVECAFTVIYLLLVARNLYKYILLLFIFLILRHIALLVASLVVASLSLWDEHVILQECVIFDSLKKFVFVHRKSKMATTAGQIKKVIHLRNQIFD